MKLFAVIVICAIMAIFAYPRHKRWVKKYVYEWGEDKPHEWTQFDRIECICMSFFFWWVIFLWILGGLVGELNFWDKPAKW